MASQVLIGYRTSWDRWHHRSEAEKESLLWAWKSNYEIPRLEEEPRKFPGLTLPRSWECPSEVGWEGQPP